MVMSAVLRPIRAAAMAASQPACPAPTTTTSYCSVKAIEFYFTGREMVARRRVRARPPALQPRLCRHPNDSGPVVGYPGDETGGAR